VFRGWAVMKRTGKLILACMGALLIFGYYAYTNITAEIPKGRPNVTFRYNGKAIPSNMGEHNWFDMKDGGNSYMAGSSYDVGQKTSSVVANLGGTIEITFSSIPKDVKVLQWLGNGTQPKAYDVKSIEKKCEFILPLDEGECVFEVIGEWDETHNTSDIIRVNIK
jgi:hypothetical protein